jgi:outer membrane receptor protein involved in Fe transport
LLNAAVWYLYLKQEFVYVGDEGITEPSGRTRRYGIDLSGRYQLNKHLFADANINLAHARFVNEQKGENYIPLAPGFTSTGGLNYKKAEGLNGSLRYRFITDRPGNEDNSVKLKGYFVTDAVVNYTKPKYEVGFIIENLTNAKWNEAQFDTESRLKDEPLPISELHFTPGNPLNLRLKAVFFF